MARTAVFTIVSKNYLHFARVLMESLERAQPEWDRFVVLADRIDKAFDPTTEHFEVIEADSLTIPDAAVFAFRYTLVEFNTAVKPWAFRHVFGRDYGRVIYLDPDILIYRPLAELEAALDGGALAVLLPHLTGRINDDARPSEHDILQSGAYNLGFCALARHPWLDPLLGYWCEKSERDFVVDLSRGLFTDQRWMDLVPGMFPDVAILRHEGYDVAYWNLPHRHLHRAGSGLLVNDVPLVFFHFSGVEPLKPRTFSKHQNRYQLANAGVAGELTGEYIALLTSHGLADVHQLPYAYGFLNDGSPIPDVLRKLFRTTKEVETWARPDPFARTLEEWNSPLDDRRPPLTRPMMAAYQARPDIRLTWPDVIGKDREPFVRWFCRSPDVDSIIPGQYRSFVVRGSTFEGSTANFEQQRDVERRTPNAERQGLLLEGAIRKALIAFRERRLPLSPVRWWRLYQLHLREHAQQELTRRSPPLPAIGWPGRTDASDSGITIVGYLDDGTGLTSGAYGSARVCAEAGIRHELVDARPASPCRRAFSVNLLHVNADQTPVAAEMLGRSFFDGRYSIGMWAWELEELPEIYAGAFEHLDEIWAGSGFIHRAVSDKAPIPVVHIPYAVEVSPTPGLTRKHFGLPENRFLFLMMYDTLSVQERKNPLGAIAAFTRAFPQPGCAGLVIRVNHASSRPDDVAEVRRALSGIDGAVLIDSPMSRADAQALQASCDAFISLHRSEGFGLNIAEAMLLGKPAIATAWSGNMDFTSPDNSCLVGYDLVTLDRDHGPYRRGNRWADPDVDQAAAWMRRLAEDRAFYDTIRLRGQKTIATEFSPQTVGVRYRKRLAAIQRRAKRPV